MSKKKVHFIGINGSGISGIACIAKSMGYEVTGCDMNEKGDYTEQLLKNDIIPLKGHDVSHIANVDLVVTSPALLYHDKYKTIEETKVAMEQGKLIKWQKFLGDYIMGKKNIVAVAGTHGKTTTTTLMSLIVEAANLDPTVFVGGIVKEWGTTYRIGNSDYYVCEGDEYDGNFLNYYPKYAILNNLEMEHPERFKNYGEYISVFINFLKNIQENGVLIFNFDDENVVNLIKSLEAKFIAKNIKLVAYTFNDENKNDEKNIKLVKVKNSKNIVNINGENFEFSVLGEHNARNISISIIAAMEMGIDTEIIKKVIKNFSGSKRRLDVILNNERIKIYDDYAHHHTQVKLTIDAIKNNIDENEKIIAVLEPHLISRIKNNTKEYRDALLTSDFPIVTKVFKSREDYMDDLDLVKILNSDKITYIENFDDIVSKIQDILNGDKAKFSILVMGAGNSYKLAKSLKENLKI